MTLKEELKVTDLIIVSVVNKQTGIPENFMVTNRPRWKKDSQVISNDWIIHIQVFPLGLFGQAKFEFHSLEEFENAINL